MSHTSHPLQQRIAAHLAPRLLCGQRVLVGLSGGLDSVVLLHCLHALAPRLGYTLEALHVHHGISPHAQAWADACGALCAELGVALQVRHVDVAPLLSQHGIEAAARSLRYAAYAASGAPYVALAHHADDQAETLLLQLLRGAGLRGVAAMPLVREHDGLTLLRPLLEQPRSALLAYAQRQGLHWVEDESNADERYPRNFLRHRVLPLLAERFPAWRETLGRSAQHFAEASGLLDEIAQADMPADGRLTVHALRAVSAARASNLLRYFLHVRGAPMPQTPQLEQMLRQLCYAADNTSPCVRFGGWEMHRYRGEVYVMQTLPPFDQSLRIAWRGDATLYWPPLQRTLRFEWSTGQGISRMQLHAGEVTLRVRNGGETLRPHAQAARRTLKNLLQQHGVPPWQRERLPLLFCGEQLVAVVGVAIDAAFQAGADEEAVMVS
ncbi:MAG: tRNA lysidine(34) synthetase TilS [Pseudomonadota bacterium]